ncbi:GntR family transcriptional regulator [Pseudomonas aeruginosa]|uniref:GntR family transcriptional regulator n=1 Tax=Pseudomonas aeruginosa TaxID=287 RepID=UPI0003B9A33E|nr:GntR family transcriptional regulator [Pseudomonas aeruginosa]KEA27599.1 GntR family transcriptional regulator [Pseudomonas aeruginosa C2773C]EJM8826849.1 GntR family transcriptional regulator [Pseudomonas aeruginosa]EKT8061472.1 GntR family transcriptional regulator [Pseudomonas aeruginosa]EKU7998600.1 GntR family transcriptional regulator [Pseudomonas aeruginosa]EKU8275019.1 GntR family transcriptional regulator [Pseudomonas aeruginosa]
MNEARYALVAKDLRDKIANGGYPVGSLLPTELELCELYEVSRHTVRAAITQLQNQGLVSRRKRVGTRVESSAPSGGYRHSLESVEDLVHLAETQVRSIQKVRHFVADIAEAERLELQPGGHYFCVSSIRIDQGRESAPMCWTDVYADEAYADVIPLAEQHPDELISALIERSFGRRIDVIDQQVKAVLISPELAQKLVAEPGTPGLKIIRHYRDEQGKLVVASETVHPDDRFTLVMHMKREKL